MMATAVFAAGCFWGVEAFFERVHGVETTRVGFMGGEVESPSYELVKEGNTGHAEVVKVEYNSEVVSYQELLDNFFECHDPTTKNRQGEDVGSQYRSEIFYSDETQQHIAEEKITEWGNKGIFKNPIVTKLTPSSEFYEAEEHHQKYLQKNGSVACGLA